MGHGRRDILLVSHVWNEGLPFIFAQIWVWFVAVPFREQCWRHWMNTPSKLLRLWRVESRDSTPQGTILHVVVFTPAAALNAVPLSTISGLAQDCSIQHQNKCGICPWPKMSEHAGFQFIFINIQESKICSNQISFHGQNDVSAFHPNFSHKNMPQQHFHGVVLHRAKPG